jgi:hypothetical protein
MTKLMKGITNVSLQNEMNCLMHFLKRTISLAAFSTFFFPLSSFSHYISDISPFSSCNIHMGLCSKGSQQNMLLLIPRPNPLQGHNSPNVPTMLGTYLYTLIGPLSPVSSSHNWNHISMVFFFYNCKDTVPITILYHLLLLIFFNLCHKPLTNSFS